jgi:signal peptidase II
MSRPLSRWRLLAAVVAAGLLADQATKLLAVDRLTVAFQRAGARTLPEKVRAFYTQSHLEPLATAPHVVFRPWWRMNYVENPGAAWSLFRDRSPGFRTVFFGLVTVAATAFILWYFRRVGERERVTQLALAAVLAGALGNFADRVAHGYVVDFIEWHWWNRPDLRWPTFNVADSLISVGVVVLLLLPGKKGG